MSGHIEEGGWIVDEGTAAGDYESANAAVYAVRTGTSLNAWLHIVLEWEGGWKDANDVRSLEATRLDPMEERWVKSCAEEIRTLPEAKGVSEGRVMIAAAKWAAKANDD